VHELAVVLDMHVLVMLPGDANLHVLEGGAEDLVHTHATEHLEQQCPSESPALAIKQLKNAIFGAPDKTQLAQTGANLRKISGNALATKTWENFKLKFEGEKKINK